MTFEGDAFISYAHLDNVELVEGRKGWITNLHRALEVRLGQLLGKPPQIWRDPKLKGNDVFAETLVGRLGAVAALVAVVSPRYLKSEWTQRELKEFWTAAEAQGGIRAGDKARIFKILKTPVPFDRTPPELRMLLGYEFFKTDPDTGKVRELDEVFGPEAQRDFWLKLDDLAHDICALLERLEAGQQPQGEPAAPAAAPTAPPQPAVSRGTVFLAETTSDLREQREALRRDLQRHGYVVLPDRTLPLVCDETQAAIREDLARSGLSIHLIGRNYGVVPEGGSTSLVELQHELATERAQGARLRRLVWIPAGLQVNDERQRQVIERLRLDTRMQEGADLLEAFFEDLRTVVQDWLKRDVAPTAARDGPAVTGDGPPLLYLMADQRDAELISPWAEGLFDAGIEVMRPMFDGDESEIREYHEESLTTCDGVLIFSGAGNEFWLRRKLRELQKAAGYGRTKPRPVVGICLVPPRTAEKERFRTHEAMVMPQWDGFAPGLLEPFVAQLRVTRSVEPIPRSSSF